MTRPILTSVVAGMLACLQGPAVAGTLLPDFSGDLFERGAAIDHPYFPLMPGHQTVLVAEGVDDEGGEFSERTERSFAGRGPKILGVRATTMLDRAFEDGVLVEETYDYFAQDRGGNVWYLGEDVTNYRYDDDGNFLGTDDESAWRAGVNGARPGWIMPASTEKGLSYYQEYAPADEALDRGLTLGILKSLEAGSATYASVLRVLETSGTDRGARDVKYYARGIGLVREEEGVDMHLGNPELVFDRVPVAPVPLPAPMLLLGAGIAALAAVRGRRRLVR